MKAALYCRVSTEQQAKTGFSVRQQIEALRRYCDDHALEVVGEFEDRASGASLYRLMLDALRDAVSGGGVDVVLAQDRDRFSREPARQVREGEGRRADPQGRMRKAQEGKIVGTGKAPQGFYYADDHYHLDQDRMLWVRRIFEMIADGHSIYEVAQYLRKTGAPPPGGVSGKWHRATIRNIILSDTYLGTFWWGKEKGTTTKVSVQRTECATSPQADRG